jgi:hypothetical protein
MQAGRWKTNRMPVRYGEYVLAARGGMARAAEVEGGIRMGRRKIESIVSAVRTDIASVGVNATAVARVGAARGILQRRPAACGTEPAWEIRAAAHGPLRTFRAERPRRLVLMSHPSICARPAGRMAAQGQAAPAT